MDMKTNSSLLTYLSGFKFENQLNFCVFNVLYIYCKKVIHRIQMRKGITNRLHFVVNFLLNIIEIMITRFFTIDFIGFNFVSAFCGEITVSNENRNRFVVVIVFQCIVS